MKRGRNQRRRQGGNNPNRALDSNGPDVRIRGTANQIYDKYIALARDASSAGDRVKAENYLQHAEHYFRVIRAMQPPQQQQQQPNVDAESEQPNVDEGGQEKGGEQRGGDRRRGGRNERRSQAKDNADAADGNTDDQNAGDSEEEEKPKRRRGRRPTKRAEKTDGDDESAPAAAE